MREVRDTPVITIVDQVTVPFKAEPRGRGIRTLLGFVVGAIVGGLLVFLKDLMGQKRVDGDPAVAEFLNTVGDVKGDILRRVRRLAGRPTA